jgi:hypothetical protein
MPLSFGSNIPSNYYLGSDAVSEIYFGDSKVWPVTTPLVNSIKILGDSFSGQFRNSISGAFAELGYVVPNITSETISNTYTGTELSASAFSVVIVYTDGSQTGATSFANNLKNYMTNGGKVIFSTFVGTGDTLNPGGTAFDVALLPFTTKTAGQGSFPISTVTINSVGHPIMNGIANGDTIGSNFFTSFTSAQVRAGATLVASLGTVAFIATHTYAGSRCVYHNLYYANQTLTANLKKTWVNSILWVNGNI